jgi:hypothetical protein
VKLRAEMKKNSGGKGIGYPFVGSLDEVMIFDRSLSSEEIKQLVTSMR